MFDNKKYSGKGPSKDLSLLVTSMKYRRAKKLQNLFQMIGLIIKEKMSFQRTKIFLYNYFLISTQWMENYFSKSNSKYYKNILEVAGVGTEMEKKPDTFIITTRWIMNFVLLRFLRYSFSSSAIYAIFIRFSKTTEPKEDQKEKFVWTHLRDSWDKENAFSRYFAARLRRVLCIYIFIPNI